MNHEEDLNHVNERAPLLESSLDASPIESSIRPTFPIASQSASVFDFPIASLSTYPRKIRTSLNKFFGQFNGVFNTDVYLLILINRLVYVI